MKFLVPNYSCLQNPWLGGYCPPDPRSLCPQLNLLNPPPKKKFLGMPLFLTLVLDRQEWLASNHSYFTPRTNKTACWVGLRAGLDAFRRTVISFLTQIKQRFLGNPAHSPVTYPTELPQLPFSTANSCSASQGSNHSSMNMKGHFVSNKHWSWSLP